MSLVTGTFESKSAGSVIFSSQESSKNLLNVIAGLSQVQTQFNQHLNIKQVVDDDVIQDGDDEEEESESEEEKPVRKNKKGRIV